MRRHLSEIAYVPAIERYLAGWESRHDRKRSSNRRFPKDALGVLLVGLGAVSTTFIAGVEAIKRGLGAPIGSLAEMGTIRLGKRTEARVPRIRDFVPASRDGRSGVRCLGPL